MTPCRHQRITALTLSGKLARATVVTSFEYPVRRGVSAPVYVHKQTIADELWIKTGTGWQEEHERHLRDNITYSATSGSN